MTRWNAERFSDESSWPDRNWTSACSGAMVAGFHHPRSMRSPRTRPGLNGQPPSPDCGSGRTFTGWMRLGRVRHRF